MAPVHEHLPLLGRDGAPSRLAPISAAVVAAPGTLVYASGQGAIDLASGRVQGETIAEQTELTIDAVEAVLARAGAALAHVVRAECYLAHVEDFAEFNRVFGARFGAPAPARTTVLCGFALPGMLVEIQVTAVVPTP
jgi:2-iminobutanoate/2-iminopropanoate deaminase